MKIAVFPGSFDPITNGHVDIIHRTLPLFDKIIIAIGENTQKKYLFPLEDRQKWIRQIFIDHKKVEVHSYEGLTVNFCRKVNAGYIIRGLRSTTDFEYEKNIAQLNAELYPELETICLVSKPENSHISSTIVREIIIHKGDVSALVPGVVAGLVKN